MSSFTIKMLRKTKLSILYGKLIRRERLSVSEREALLKIALILINAGDENTQELGYRIIVIYGNLFDDYVPLYDISLNKGYVPVLKVIEKHPRLRSQFREKFFNIYISSSAELYREDGLYLTYQQHNLKEFFNINTKKSVAIIAPTSYGKSELIVNFCNRNPATNICIIVPTKALLAQTRRRLLKSLNARSNRKIITHPEMYNIGDSCFIAVLTQERLLRLLRKDVTLSFDTAFIDEAHNALDSDQRNVLLAKAIALLEFRNKNIAFKFLTPFLVDSNNLKARYTDYNIEQFKISESIKTERYYSINFNNGGILKAYDQYLNEFIPITEEKYSDDIHFIEKKCASKNIIYLNSPPKIERFAKRLISKTKIIDDEELILACKDISRFLHSEYVLIDCLKRGFAYHHGSVPDIVRLYIEHLFSKNDNVSIIITSSTLLEGVNVPAEKLFLLEYTKGNRKLSPSQFKNLSGRVCRFNEIFSDRGSSLKMLEPAIYVIGSEYVRSDANIENFLMNSVKIDKTIKDEPENVLLKATEIDDDNLNDKQQADEMLENIQKGITGEKAKYAETDVGTLCFLNNINEIPILEYEHQIAESIEHIEGHKLNTPELLLKTISDSFIKYINKNHPEYLRLSRLNEESAQKFYSMFIKWRMRSASYREMIRSFLRYWDKEDVEKIVYVGKWGDTKKEGHRELWVDISAKNIKERVNLSIVRIKEEQDFVDNIIIKYVEVLYELNLVDETLYLKIKYGTDDNRKIIMIKNGISSTLASLLIKKYMKFVSIDIETNQVKIASGIIENMRMNGENRVLIFEVGFNTNN
jgi:hypothetical protein